MSVGINTNFTARDFQFELNDSCNCCRSRKPTAGTLVYVTTSGVLEKYDFKKASVEWVAHTRSLNHLLSVLHSFVAEEDKDRMINRVALHCGFYLRRDKMPLTWETMEKINAAIEIIVGESQTEERGKAIEEEIFVFEEDLNVE